MRHNEKVVRKGVFKGITYPSIKKYAFDKGELTLTSKHLSINCEGKWKKTFRNWEIQLEANDRILEIRGTWYRTLLFRLIVDESEEWVNTFEKISFEDLREEYESIMDDNKRLERENKRLEEWKKLFEISPKALKKIHDDIRKEMTQFRRKNLRFNLEIQRFIRILKNRRLKAYIIAHSFVAWYEWTKGLLSKIYKAKMGKGPENDEELIRFLYDYPSLGILDTEEWEVKANQIRNCVAHERFYYDYKPSEIVFIVNGKEKRIKLREIEWSLMSISNTYQTLLQYIREKIERGEISPKKFIF
jgi:hypothetical protein